MPFIISAKSRADKHFPLFYANFHARGKPAALIINHVSYAKAQFISILESFFCDQITRHSIPDLAQIAAF
jgi:hypothetical protein